MTLYCLPYVTIHNCLKLSWLRCIIPPLINSIFNTQPVEEGWERCRKQSLWELKAGLGRFWLPIGRGSIFKERSSTDTIQRCEFMGIYTSTSRAHCMYFKVVLKTKVAERCRQSNRDLLVDLKHVK